VILAAGAASIPGAPGEAAMTPVKGQMIAFAAERPLAPNHVVRAFELYLAAKPGVRLVAGSTSEPGEAGLETDPDAVAALAERAARVTPGLKAAPVLERWAGLRPRSRDAMPVVGEASPGLFIAGGAYRNGVLLAPIIAEGLAELVLAGRELDLLAPFAPGRAALTSAQR